MRARNGLTHYTKWYESAINDSLHRALEAGLLPAPQGTLLRCLYGSFPKTKNSTQEVTLVGESPNSRQATQRSEHDPTRRRVEGTSQEAHVGKGDDRLWTGSFDSFRRHSFIIDPPQQAGQQAPPPRSRLTRRLRPSSSRRHSATGGPAGSRPHSRSCRLVPPRAASSEPAMSSRDLLPEANTSALVSGPPVPGDRSGALEPSSRLTRARSTTSFCS